MGPAPGQELVPGPSLTAAATAAATTTTATATTTVTTATATPTEETTASDSASFRHIVDHNFAFVQLNIEAENLGFQGR